MTKEIYLKVMWLKPNAEMSIEYKFTEKRLDHNHLQEIVQMEERKLLHNVNLGGANVIILSIVFKTSKKCIPVEEMRALNSHAIQRDVKFHRKLSIRRKNEEHENNVVI